MATILSRFYIGQPGTTVAKLGETVPPEYSQIMKQILLCNTTGSAATISIHVVPSGNTATNANRILSNVTIDPNSTETLDLTQVLVAGDELWGVQGTSGAITVCISGVVRS